MSGETKRDVAALQQVSVPSDCFRLEELECFQALENQVLVGVSYYIWLHADVLAQQENRGFLYFLALTFADHNSLLLTCGEDSTAIQVSTEADLLDTASRLHVLHGQASIQRLQADTSPIWQSLIGNTLTTINLSRHESGLYANTALELDFGDSQIVVQLAQKEGLEIIRA
jgi:hypothetical protein